MKGKTENRKKKKKKEEQNTISNLLLLHTRQNSTEEVKLYRFFHLAHVYSRGDKSGFMRRERKQRSCHFTF